MIITEYQARKILKALYNTAEKDHNDVIANAASALAVRLELPKKTYIISDLEVRIIQHSFAKMSKNESEIKTRRKTYKRRVSLA